jgi:hypothetical protein
MYQSMLGKEVGARREFICGSFDGLDQGSTAPFAFLSAPGASSGQTSVRAVEEPWLPLGNLSADAPGAAELQCALKGGKPLV